MSGVGLSCGGAGDRAIGLVRESGKPAALPLGGEGGDPGCCSSVDLAVAVVVVVIAVAVVEDDEEGL